MSSATDIIDLLFAPIVLRSLLVVGVFSLALCTSFRGRSPLEVGKQCVRNYILPVILPTIIARAWLYFVNRAVPEPYLDEFFHIPQAQVYCKGRYFEWDDKITTPPGLYILSIVWARVLGYEDCSPETLRRFNVFVIECTAILAAACRGAVETHGSTGRGVSNYAIHTAINIGLFPVLFFFSGLYYTDVLSTCVVLLAYRNHLGRISSSAKRSCLLNDLYTVLLGVLALFMRQTNVFWVVVYMGGLEAIQAIRDIKLDTAEAPASTAVLDQIKFYAWRYSLGDIHDPSLNKAWPDDLVLCVLSIGIAAISNPLTILRRVYPHITTMTLFAVFVAWNGGVVLGDKSNHIATIHLAQMLYIWPLFAFFSAPLFIPQALRILQPLQVLVTHPSSTSVQARSTLNNKSTSTVLAETKKPFDALLNLGPVLSLPVILACVLVALAIVHFNTIIHPFTLADNRHYMFYIFRYTILRGSMVRLALAPAYVFCAYLSWTALSGRVPPWVRGADPAGPLALQKEYFISTPIRRPDTDGAKADRAAITTTTTAQLKKGRATTESKPQGSNVSPADLSTARPPPASTVLMFIATTALSLVTAPLVEPRYFILPWVFWRLLVPAWPGPSGPPAKKATTTTRETPGSSAGFLASVGAVVCAAQRRVDLRLALETAWFLLINAATMYIFLTRPFFWRAEDGSLLDGGNVQRFMW
ncbi:DIE2/ALG10 family-domain-containing protein [Xylariales sp. PMI_506]|nr:DIE2/ALG10 family-domain-containing protein [Xylariales sp. PMI_506]